MPDPVATPELEPETYGEWRKCPTCGGDGNQMQTAFDGNCEAAWAHGLLSYRQRMMLGNAEADRLRRLARIVSAPTEEEMETLKLQTNLFLAEATINNLLRALARLAVDGAK